MASEPHQTEEELAFARSRASAKPLGVIARKTIFLTFELRARPVRAVDPAANC